DGGASVDPALGLGESEKAAPLQSLKRPMIAVQLGEEMLHPLLHDLGISESVVAEHLRPSDQVAHPLQHGMGDSLSVEEGLPSRLLRPCVLNLLDPALDSFVEPHSCLHGNAVLVRVEVLVRQRREDVLRLDARPIGICPILTMGGEVTK